MKPKNIAVLMGGTSHEREISLRSGNAVAKALMDAGCNVFCIDVKDEKIQELDTREIDVAFIALHGCFGEDGGVQQLLESKGIPYTGSGINASKLAMDKLATKKCFIEMGLKTPDYIAITEFQEMTEIEHEIKKFGLPVILKPTRNGSSIGISIVRDGNNLRINLEKAFEFGCELLIERYIEGREFTVGILDDKALPIIEIKPAMEFFNYDAKYKDGRTQYLIVEITSEGKDIAGDAPYNLGYLPSFLYNRAQELALNAHRVLGCKGFSRVDILMDTEANFYLLEVNTIPGFTEKSLLPKAARAAGISFPSLCREIVNLAFQNTLVNVDESIQS
ncbi:MAG: D-alanine--D-alanine ligase [Candidatus Jettenia sp.]|uniref:D-alanine--D-alanine ligase n=1 Tax=Candidatus Jettenia caeni TaxID=247490 RepID=I3IQL1_9BACT|nr:D-alanine--D-alanine ligase [Candidatus Jettenia sp. AMX1]MBC6928631.1 D-alanine--D-alanine ligase [Candidatus Jettenia sp.]NUN22187.1 D-alanine--D-alanine ligase [Candidatus Jettenia caeni]KAA0249887.1 MAG: D-alanine--D-alanine ligase [Candidatus Jettenia sp. AMX1]MCE7880584.1 D-alanine--D-alanine ligase [Candidatus Jettenia sp. AMX1]MCQ3927264.1 D-alanine--D-alanine ligase [Candidatus Jettenia sp.]